MLPWTEKIKASAMARFRDQAGKECKEPHQWRLRNRTLRRGADRLIAREEDLRNAVCFDKIHTIVKECRVKGLGKLWVYDTALRIAPRNKYPEMVYLYAGTRKGAKALGFDGRDTLSCSEIGSLYPELMRLKCYQMEDFFCLAKDGLRRRKRC